MNRHEFYDNLNKYQSLSHSGNYKYYNKIDLPDGKSRYFYTKAEWDAYQEGKARNKYEQQKKTIANNKAADEAKAKANQENSTVVKNNKAAEEAKKKAEERNNMSGYTKWKQQKETFEKNKAADKDEGNRKGFLSNWEKDLHTHNDTQSSIRDKTDNIRYECDVDIDDRKINDTLNNFYNAVKVGSTVTAFDSTGMSNLYDSMFKGDEKSRKDLLSRIQRSIDIYEQDIDKFEKQLNDYLNERYGDKDWIIKKDHDAVMNKLKETYEEIKKNYKDIDTDFDGWREAQINNYFGDYLRKGLTNKKDIAELQKNGIDEYIEKVIEYQGYNNPKAYDEKAQKMIKDTLRKVCEKTLSQIDN